MSFIVDKFKAGEVVIREDVCGWYFPETDEFRPLMNDAMEKLVNAGLVTQEQKNATGIANAEHSVKAFKAYAKSQEEFWNDPANKEAQREQLFEMRAAFGPGAEVVNAITGRKHTV